MRMDMPIALRVITLAWMTAASQACVAECRSTSSAQPPAIVELYTSEGCSSCPPADRWASTLKGRDDVLVLAFHVNYWDKLGWPDRFATAVNTQRQRLLQKESGASYVYTPQVVHNGRDLRGWSKAELKPLARSTADVTLVRQGNTVRATVDAPELHVAGFWAVLEDGHRSRVTAGENAGEALTHDHVVTRYEPVSAWNGSAGRRSFTLEIASTPTTSRRVAFVVTDAGGARPLQAGWLSC